ncbi:MAG: hypothetical protein K8R58_11970 [Bacteroidales bacterium]|nr:hypothetical protein [Bacteroidales bacterium]
MSSLRLCDSAFRIFDGTLRRRDTKNWEEYGGIPLYHYTLIHYPNISTYPHHNHVSDDVISSSKPNFLKILSEINEYQKMMFNRNV